MNIKKLIDRLHDLMEDVKDKVSDLIDYLEDRPGLKKIIGTIILLLVSAKLLSYVFGSIAESLKVIGIVVITIVGFVSFVVLLVWLFVNNKNKYDEDSKYY